MIAGEESPEDLNLLLKDSVHQLGVSNPVPYLTEKVQMLTKNEEAKIRSTNEGIINIRPKCVGIQAIN